MTIYLSGPVTHELRPRITVVGVGGAGTNAVNNMITAHLEGVEFVACNTDAQSLAHSLTERKIQLGTSITQGLGAGARPEIGRAAAEEAIDEVLDQLQGSHMVFITAGMGGGTGTGATPVIARAVREQGILTVGVVTKPFHFEGAHRMRVAEAGLTELQQYVDTLVVIPNQNLFRIANERTTFAEAFKLADKVLYMGVRGVTDLMVMPGLINLDFADIRTVMSEMGKAMMGTGEGSGDRRAIEAAEAAISNPLLDEVSMRGARGVLINITGGPDMTLFEVDEAANRIKEEVDPEANIIVGSTLDESVNGDMRVSVVATGIEVREAKSQPAAEAAETKPAAEAAETKPAVSAPSFHLRPQTPSTSLFPVKPASIAADPAIKNTLSPESDATAISVEDIHLKFESDGDDIDVIENIPIEDVMERLDDIGQVSEALVATAKKLARMMNTPATYLLVALNEEVLDLEQLPAESMELLPIESVKKRLQELGSDSQLLISKLRSLLYPARDNKDAGNALAPTKPAATDVVITSGRESVPAEVTRPFLHPPLPPQERFQEWGRLRAPVREPERAPSLFERVTASFGRHRPVGSSQAGGTASEGAARDSGDPENTARKADDPESATKDSAEKDEYDIPAFLRR